MTQAMLYYLCCSSTPLLSTTAYFTLSAYIYITWVYTIWSAIRVPPTVEEVNTQHSDPSNTVPQDDENWTPVHPDVMSAPELDTFIKDSKTKIYQVNLKVPEQRFYNSFYSFLQLLAFIRLFLV